MSYTSIAVVVSLVISLLPLLALARHDPKRLRSIRLRHHIKPHVRRTRQFYGAIVLLPGIVLALRGDWPAFLIWMGALIASGWLLVQILAARATSLASKKPR